jgi:N-alpha-acetyl-L-2,4-diaminobutyrate deacetylase
MSDIPVVRDFDPLGVPPGAVRRVQWMFATAPDGTPAVIPLIVIAGKGPGKTAALVAGIHGDEYEGIVALWRLAETLTPSQISGRLIIVPIAHLTAYNAALRISPIDSVNLARVFPGDPGGTITYRLAHHLFTQIISKADVLVDCHSGGVRMAFAPVAGFYQPGNGITDAVSAASLDAACWLGLPNLWALPPRAGVLSYEAARCGLAVTGAEIGGRGGRLDSDSELYRVGIRRVLQAHGILAGDPGPAQHYTHYLDGDWALAPAAGLLENHVALGDHVQAGTHIATIRDALGVEQARLTAAVSGFVMGVRHLCAIQVGEWATCVVEEKPL